MNKKNSGAIMFVSALAYTGLLFFLPQTLFPESDFAGFHGKQGFRLLLLQFASFLFVGVTGQIISLFATILMIVGIIHVIKGEKKELPVIGKLHFEKSASSV